MKKLCLALAVMLIASCAMVAVASAGSTFYVVSPNGKGVNVRSAPWKEDYNIIANLPYGTVVTVEYFNNNEWAEIKWSNQSGFIMRRYLNASKPGPYNPAEHQQKSSSKDVYSGFEFVEGETVTVQNSRSGAVAKLRWAPDKSAGLMTVLHTGDKVNVLAVSKDWYQVEDPETGKVGFLNTAFIKK